MSTFLSSPAGTKSVIRRLVSSTASGKKYSRRADVEAEIQRVLRLHQSLWIKEAPNLHNETLVFLMRLVRRADEQLFNEFFQELCIRIVRIAGIWASRFHLDRTTAEEIVDEVELNLIELVLSGEPSRQSEFLEIAFGKAVERRTLNRRRRHKNSMQGHRGWVEAAGDEDGALDSEQMERALELTPDDGPDPEAIVLKKELIRKAWAAIDDPQILQAFVPITKTAGPSRAKTGRSRTWCTSFAQARTRSGIGSKEVCNSCVMQLEGRNDGKNHIRRCPG